MYKLQFPNISHKAEYLSMIAEWKAFETTPTSPGRLFAGENYEEFLQIIEQDVTNSPR
jgi:predicted acetyltransferase